MSGGPIDLNRVLPADLSPGGYEGEPFVPQALVAPFDPGLLDVYRQNSQVDRRVTGVDDFARLPPQSPGAYAQGLYDARDLLAGNPAVPDDLGAAGIALLDEALSGQAAARDDGWE
ncbi:hypothetical protein [Futiania mangrovi]|uniref:Uncharacterized protein n=1 Tax=Futiania mangrovi TaxID=2959716 RepID=A0A9J6PDR8_9PROT|nr:hypothetical protein [Futiania mangrovii]MCP1336793.1 hypothetical protein [Futiania mangrovii]